MIPLESFCPICGAGVLADEHYCRVCSYDLRGWRGEGQPADRPGDAVTPPSRPWGRRALALLLAATLIMPPIGIDAGLRSVAIRARRPQAMLLLITGFLVIAFWLVLMLVA